MIQHGLHVGMKAVGFKFESTGTIEYAEFNDKHVNVIGEIQQISGTFFTIYFPSTGDWSLYPIEYWQIAIEEHIKFIKNL